MSIMSDEVNFLVYRYLQESGYQHSAFSFGIESHITQSNINNTVVPPGALVNLLQKGIQFIEGELCVTDEGNLLENLDILGSIPLIDAVVPEALAERVQTIYRLISQKVDAKKKLNQYAAELQDDDESILLHGHRREVFGCDWHPTENIVTTGAADGVAGLWYLDSEEIKIIELNHAQDVNSKFTQSSDVTSLTWNPDGQTLATASTIENAIRIWNMEGNLLATLCGHKDTVMTLKWNSKGNLLLSASLDKKCILWNADTWQALREFQYHSGPVTDVDWQNEDIFASCSTDKLIFVCKMDSDQPLHTLQSHTADINCIEWNKSGDVLASCGDDKLVKLWNTKGGFHDLAGHTKEVTQLKWNSKKLLASASYDATIRIWNTEQCTCLQTLNKHEDPINSISFHPDGDFLVSGALDGLLNVWNVQTGACIHTKRNTNGTGIFEVQWSPDASYICVCQTDSDVRILDAKKITASNNSSS